MLEVADTPPRLSRLLDRLNPGAVRRLPLGVVVADVRRGVIPAPPLLPSLETHWIGENSPYMGLHTKYLWEMHCQQWTKHGLKYVDV